MVIPKEAKTKVEEITVKVTVTENDIRLGQQGEPTTCAIARSLKNQFKERDVYVDQDDIKVDGFEAPYVPKKVNDFIEKFDEDKKTVKPFSFLLKLIRKNED